jgi:nucleoside-diphosphate-sugar epimerase
MNLYATGASGTIGQHFVGVSPLVGRLNPYSYDVSSLESPGAVLHFASVVGVEKVNSDVAEARKVNVDGTTKLATDVYFNSDAKFVFASTSHVYEKSDLPLSEDTTLNPRSNYAIQKLEAELSCIEIFKDKPERLLILRIFSILGWSCGPKTLAASIIHHLENPANSSIKNGNDVRDFLSPKQVAAITSRLSGDHQAYGIVNVCSGSGLKVGDAASNFASQKGVSFISCEAGTSDTPILIGDNSKLRKLLGVDEINWTLDDFPQ